MSKRIISQARGKGSPTYRVRGQAYRYKLQYPKKLEGEGAILRLLNSPAHSAPIAKIGHKGEAFYVPAFKGAIEGQKINFDGNVVREGNILRLKDMPIKTSIFSIESRPGDGGVFIKTAGSSAVINKVIGNKVFVLMPSKKEKDLHENCRAIVGVISGAGRLDKPILKAGKKHHMKKARNKFWPRTSAIKMNIVDHPFGSGRGKHPKSKIAKRNAPPGARVGLIRPRRTGIRK